MGKDIILITGASGQIGSVLTDELRNKFGAEQVIATDIRQNRTGNGLFEQLDITDSKRLGDIIERYGVSQIYHLVAILSAKGETNPRRTWDINIGGLLNVLDAARDFQLDKVFFPSSIAVFGPLTPRHQTPQHTILNPSTVYGISKQAGELWCSYYHKRYDLDVRSVRYPGIIGHQSMAGGGTTDYAVDIFHEAVKGKDYTCFLSEDTRLPMMYMSDAIRATLQLMEAPADSLRVRSSYNVASLDFTPAELTAAIQKFMPNFKTHYQPDSRQAIADSWPASIDDSIARQDWYWQPNFDLEAMTKDMLWHLSKKYDISNIHIS